MNPERKLPVRASNRRVQVRSLASPDGGFPVSLVRRDLGKAGLKRTVGNRSGFHKVPVSGPDPDGKAIITAAWRCLSTMVNKWWNGSGTTAGT